MIDINIPALALVIGFIIFILLICVFMFYLEEKNKCKHKWVETNRNYWKSFAGGDIIRIELTCKLCGDIKIKRIP